MNEGKPIAESQLPAKFTRNKVIIYKYLAATALITLLSVAIAGVYPLASSATLGARGVELAPIEATISGNSQQQIEFTVTNRRAATINIAGVSTSCGCTVFNTPNPRTVAAGGRSILKARATPPGIGEKRVQIEVYVEGEARPLVARLTLKGREPPIPSLNWQPSEVVARGALGSDQVEEFVMLSTERQGAPPWISGAHCDSPGVKVEIASPNEERGPSPATVRRKYPVSVTATLEQPGRIRLGEISLELSSPADGSAPRPIPVFSDCRPTVEAAPDTVFASVRSDELPKEIIVRFRAPSMKTPLELKPDPIEVAWLEVDGPRASGLAALFCAELPIRIIAIPDDDNAATRRTTIRLRTNAPDCPILEIPVYVQPKS